MEKGNNENRRNFRHERATTSQNPRTAVLKPIQEKDVTENKFKAS